MRLYKQSRVPGRKCAVPWPSGFSCGILHQKCLFLHAGGHCRAGIPYSCSFSSSTPDSAWNDACVGDLRRVKAILLGYFEEMNEGSTSDKKHSPVDKRSVFVVHGHDAALKLDVARLMEKVGIRAVILSEQPNCGSTIIEKIEKNSKVGAAICLFTADDECKDGAKRARQNVVLETGYFWGKLGRDRVVILAEKGVELPSDMQGVVYADTANWQFSVCMELRQMGYDVDLNRLA